MDPPSSPESSIAASPPRRDNDNTVVATSSSSASTPTTSPTPRRRLLGEDSSNNDDDDDDDDEVIPATPMNSSTQDRGTPATPLSPLLGLDDDEDEADNAVPVDDNDEDVPQQPQLEHDDDYEDEPGDDTVTLARGTDVNVRVAAATFRDFLRSFTSLRKTNQDDDSDSDDDDDSMDNNNAQEPLYLAKLQALLHHTTPCSLDIDTMHLFYHNEDTQRLYHQLVHYPMELVPLMDLVVQREVRRLLANDDDPLPPVQVRPFNLKDVSNLRCLDPIAMDSMVCLKGMIVRCSPVIPDLKVAHFTCVICGHDHQVTIDRGRIQEPHQCPSCNTKDTYQLMHNRSLFADKQLVRLQETPDQVPAGQTPASLVTFCFDTLVDQVQPGDKVEVTGILRAQPVRVNPKITKLKSVFKTYVDVIHFRSVTGMERNQQGAKLTTDRVAELHRLSQQPDIYNQLTQSLAPSIWELDNVKKGVLCMLFGGNHRRVSKEKATRENNEEEEEWSEDEDKQDEDKSDTKLNKRGDINILLCGDPGTSKSQLLSYVHKLSSRGIYTSGKGSSAVGLTASVVRDPETRDLVLESGALVLSDRGICCIDEFDKMTDAVRYKNMCRSLLFHHSFTNDQFFPIFRLDLFFTKPWNSRLSALPKLASLRPSMLAPPFWRLPIPLNLGTIPI
jgi:hypothetical protein